MLVRTARSDNRPSSTVTAADPAFGVDCIARCRYRLAGLEQAFDVQRDRLRHIRERIAEGVAGREAARQIRDRDAPRAIAPIPMHDNEILHHLPQGHPACR